MTKVLFKVDKSIKLEKNYIKSEYRKLGKLSFEEKGVSIIFLITALLWIFRSDINFGFMVVPGWSNLLPTSQFIDDGTIAIAMALILFLIPSRSGKRNLLNHNSFQKVPWGIILLFGGGFALAKGFTTTGLSEFIGQQLTSLSSVNPFWIIILTAALSASLTEFMSNTALTQMLLPIVASFSVALGINPLLLMITATLSASMAFMLPVSTPPNAIIFAGGRIKISEMAKTGFLLNITAVIIISIFVYFWGSLIFGLREFPSWVIP
jgi:sodium-dependent dicarboxylate transporter 2/3/5